MRYAFALLLLAGCSGPDPVRIIGTCEVRGDATRMLWDQPPAALGPTPSVGLVGSHALLTWVEGLEGPYTVRGRWYGPDLEPTSDRISLGSGFGYRSKWTRIGDALHGQVWADPDGYDGMTPEGELVYLWELSPDGPARASQVPLDISTSLLGYLGLRVGAVPNTPGAQAILPSAAIDEEMVGAAVAIPSHCWHQGGNARLYLVRPDGGQLVRWTDEVCTDGPGFEMAVFNPWVFDLDSQYIGVLLKVRTESNDPDPVRLLRIPKDGSMPEPPVIVGRRFTSPEGGNQPRGVRVEGDAVLFTELRPKSGASGAGSNRCHAIRIMRTDGSEARDAPWQLPCTRGHVRTSMVELFAVDGGAILVWNERTEPELDPDGSSYVTRDVDWQEGVYAVLLTARGQRGSNVLRLTDSPATALSDVPRTETEGPVVRDFYIGAAADGNEAVVVWTDNRPGAQGIYGRRFRCVVGE